MTAIPWPILLLSADCLPACPEDVVVTPRPVCDPIVDGVEPAFGPQEGGTAAALTGLWLHSSQGERDVIVRLAGVDADVDSTERGDGCAPCLACSLDALRCDECDRVCRGELGWTDVASGEILGPSVCVETIWIQTPPAAEPGLATLTVQNVHGGVVGPEFEYLAP